MSWRSVVITQASYLSLGHGALLIKQGEQSAQVPLEDMAVLLIDNPQVTLSSQLLCACAEAKIAVITVGADHHPNGLYLPFLPHSRALKVMQAQLAIAQPLRKRLHQRLIRRKLENQAQVLKARGMEDTCRLLLAMVERVRSGDPDNLEAQAALAYFRALYGVSFSRGEARFYNSAMNYGYAVVRAAIARALVCYGFLPAFGLFHRSEQNAFNLADDLIEPYRAFVDALILARFPDEAMAVMGRAEKASLVALLHQDLVLDEHLAEDGACTLLAAIDSTVMSLARAIAQQEPTLLNLPSLPASELRRQRLKPEDDDE